MHSFLHQNKLKERKSLYKGLLAPYSACAWHVFRSAIVQYSRSKCRSIPHIRSNCTKTTLRIRQKSYQINVSVAVQLRRHGDGHLYENTRKTIALPSVMKSAEPRGTPCMLSWSMQITIGAVPSRSMEKRHQYTNSWSRPLWARYRT